MRQKALRKRKKGKLKNKWNDEFRTGVLQRRYEEIELKKITSDRKKWI